MTILGASHQGPAAWRTLLAAWSILACLLFTRAWGGTPEPVLRRVVAIQPAADTLPSPPARAIGNGNSPYAPSLLPAEFAPD